MQIRPQRMSDLTAETVMNNHEMVEFRSESVAKIRFTEDSYFYAANVQPGTTGDIQGTCIEP
jgi:hypothetical protein